jgi:O-Antigen ligase
MQPNTAPSQNAPDATAPATILRGTWPALPALAVVIFVLLRLAFDDGGYFAAAFTSAGAIAFIALAVLIVRPPPQRLSTPALIAIGALAAFACWTGLSRTWSVVPDAPLLDMWRAMLYLALFALGLLAADSGRNARVLVWSVLGVVVTICAAGLLSRLQPDLVSVTTDPFLAVFYRLDHPLGYWNAFGAVASLGVVLALGLAADVRAHVILRSAATGAALLLAVAMYLSLSRGAWLALIVGLVVLFAIAPRRWTLLLTLAIVGATAAIGVLRLDGYPALVLDPDAGSGQADQGSAFTSELVGLLALAVAAQVALCLIRVPSLLESQLATLRRIAFGASAVVLVLVAVVGYAAKGDEAEGGAAAAVDDTTAWLDRQWEEFLNPTANASEGTGAARLTSVKGARSDLYRVAFDGFEAQPLTGGGAGSFEVRYARERSVGATARDAHSLPIEVLSELGATGMILLLGFLGAVAVGARRSIAGKGVVRPAEAAAVTAAFVVWLAHASVDWDWEMPALTGIATVLSASLFQRGRRRRSRRRGSAVRGGAS